MEEVLEGVAELAKMRQMRPSFARVISWELSENDCSKEANKPHAKDGYEQQRAKKDGMRDSSEDTSATESEESEYYSATETLDVSIDECGHSLGSRNDPFHDQDPGKTRHSLETPLPNLDPQAQKQRKHSSRRKKKWKRRSLKAEYDTPYSHVESININPVEDMKVAAQERHFDKGLPLCRIVPTLTTLCLRANNVHKHEQHQREAFAESAPGVKHMVKGYNENQSFRSLQLSWLQKILQFYESLANHPTSWNIQWLVTTTNNGIDTTTYIPIGRQPWSSSIWEEDVQGNQLALHTGIDWIPLSSLTAVTVPKATQPNCIQAISAMIDTLELMIPPLITTRLLPSSSTDSEEIQDKACVTAVFRVRRLLHSRFPKMVKHFFQVALPYVWWKRGNLKLAEKYFLAVLEDVDNDPSYMTGSSCSPIFPQHLAARTKAQYMCELARMYNMVGEIHLATRYYSAALECVLLEPKCKGATSTNQLQFHAMSASLLDTGLLTASKAKLAAKAWCDVQSLENGDRLGINVAAFISSICYHGATGCTGNKDWYLEKIAMLKAHCQTLPTNALGVSLLYAMIGCKEQSVSFFREYNNRVAMMNPGTVCPVSSVFEPYPWEPIANQASEQQQPIHFIQMIWRTCLCHPVIPPNDRGTTERPLLADHYVDRDIKLRFTAEGYLTCDMELLLPPIHNVKLDPYTGKVDLSADIGGKMSVWHDLPNQAPAGTLLPRIIRLYENTDRNTAVNLLLSSIKLDDRDTTETCHCAMIEWKGPDGQKAKIDIRKLMKLEKKKIVEHCIREAHHQLPEKDANDEYTFSNQWTNDMMEILQKYYDYGWEFSYEMLSLEVKQEYQKKAKKNDDKSGSQKLSQKEKRKEKRNKKAKKDKFDHHLFEMDISDHHVIRDTVVLQITYQRHWNAVLMFFDCTRMDTFNSPKIVPIANVFNKRGGWNAFPLNNISTTMFAELKKSEPNIDVLVMCDFSADSYLQNISRPLPQQHRVCIFNTHGELLQEHHLEISRGIQRVTIMEKVIDHCLFGIHPSEQRVVSSRLTRSFMSNKLADTITSIEVLGKNILVMTEAGLYVCDTNLQFIQWNLPPASSSIVINEGFCLQGLTNSKGLQVCASQISMNSRSDQQVPINQTIFGFGNRVYVAEVPIDPSALFISIILDVQLPGWLSEGAFISDHMGIVVTASFEDQRPDSLYHESLYHISYDGRVKGILPFLGPGPHCIKPAHLPPHDQLNEKHPELPFKDDGWFLYFHDGKGAICCARLNYVWEN